MKVLVAGATGNPGRAVVEELERRGHATHELARGERRLAEWLRARP